MAPKQLLLEGPAIEPLLEKVWAEHGADVKIVKAERVRVGGVAGFFAREQFEVTVEVPDPVPGSAAAPSAPSAPSAPTTMTRAAGPAPAPRAPQGAQAPRPSTPAGTGPRTAAPAQPAGGLEALLAAAEQGDADARPAVPSRPARFASPPTAPAPAAAAAAAPAAPAPTASLDDFDAIFGAVTGGGPLSPAARAVAEAFAASTAAAAQAPTAKEADDPWVDGPPPGSTPRSTRALVGRVAGAPAPQAGVPLSVPVQHRPAEPEPPQPADPEEAPEPELSAPASVLPETPLVEPWRAPWEAEAAAAAAAHTARALEAEAATRAAEQLTADGADDVEAPAPAFAPVALTAVATVAMAAAAPAAPAAPAPVTSGGLAGAPTATPLPRRVGRSFAPLPAGPQSDGYALQRSAVLRLPETDPRLAPLAPLLESLADDDAGWASVPSAPLAAAPAPAPLQDPQDRRAADRLAQRLAALGVPPPWLWDLPAGRSAALRELARRIGSAPVRSRTSPVAEPVVAVLADLEDALPVAQHLATGMGLGEEDVVVMGRRVRGVAAERCVPSRQELQEAAQDARAERRSLVVVLPAPIGAAPPVRAAVADTLEQLAPDEVWAVVDATRRLDDTAAWLTAVAGERGVDALALTNTDVTSAPAAALALPAPVVLVGDRPATPEAWVSMLAARLAAQELR